MRNVLKIIVRRLLFILLLTASACGGGGGGDDTAQQQDQAVVTLTLNGGSDTIGSLDFDLILPAGFSLATDAQGDLTDSVLTSTLPSDSTIETTYLPEDSLNPAAQLSIGAINTGGFSAGVSLTLTRDLATDVVLPAPGDFTVSNLEVSNGGLPFSGYSIEIGVERQTRSL